MLLVYHGYIKNIKNNMYEETLHGEQMRIVEWNNESNIYLKSMKVDLTPFAITEANIVKRQ